MKVRTAFVPAILLATLAATAAHAVPQTAEKLVAAGSGHAVELTNHGQWPLKIVSRPGPDRSGEQNPTDNGIVELRIEPGKSAVVHGPYSTYELTPTPESAALSNSYVSGS